MTECITAIVIGLFQIILSTRLIIRKKNGTAIVTEIISSIILLFVLNDFSVELHNVLWLGIAFLEYLCVKVFLIVFILVARYYSFYKIKALCNDKKKNAHHNIKLIRTINNIEYWPRLKLGLPGKANKTSSKTNVIFDEKGFPIFRVYYTVKLRRKDYKASRERHFYIANKKLYKDKTPSAKIKAKLSRKQIKQLSQGQTPDGYTWHHHQDAGVLQLVEAATHAKTYHYGGYSIWGSK